MKVGRTCTPQQQQKQLQEGGTKKDQERKNSILDGFSQQKAEMCNEYNIRGAVNNYIKPFMME